MVTFVLIALGVLALFVAVLLGALVELHRDVRQVRDALGILDRPLGVDLADVAGTKPGLYGLPQLDHIAAGLVLFLSERCATCRVLAMTFGGMIPKDLWVVLDGRGPALINTFLEQTGLDVVEAGGRLIVDVEGRIMSSLGLSTTPVGIRLENGVFTHATTVPSARYLTTILPEPIRLRRAG